MRDSEQRRHKAVERSNQSHQVNRLVAPHLKQLQDQGLAPAISPGELKVLTFLDAGIETYSGDIQPAVAEVVQQQVQAMKRWTPKAVMNFLETSRENPEDSIGTISSLEKAETPYQAVFLLIGRYRYN